MSAAIAVRDLSYSVGSATILRGVELDVAPGEWVCLVGPNGAGKSTLLRAVAGLLPRRGRSGAVLLDGRPSGQLTARQRARRIAVVAQLPEVPIGMSVRDYVLLGRTPHLGPLRGPGPRDRAIVADVLAQLDLLGRGERLLSTMSGGELQRVFLARALAQQPAVLLLDEPTAALDIGHQQDVLELVDRLRLSTGLTVLATMHDLSLVGQYADRIVVLARGRVVAAGPAPAVLTRELVARVYRARVEVLAEASVAGTRGPVIVAVREPR